mmetsp:Transcript_21553/g.26677  ORF Transcript_21553/g.26677 Transcript_21553/m.26677 type:complete len:108 (-) Transcript_21553:272-595(-)|eukprot:CAMPEP_0172495716 /NCGR_PEP_ID=MMETSP1066-20121228/75042_1 /TAXON_ID=671091 /ORGANISM="Coscinodiscus wailesii, Strain CCMP2513" /LENGTH=107 /DNA_ID=CAMNT_0013267563 /DNA_START=185 /DNA_END=508 /DNA_ORIENTATION=-
MSNLLGLWVQGSMEDPDKRLAYFKDRVAENSINAERLVQEGNAPMKPFEFWKNERREGDPKSFYYANSWQKSREEGHVNSFKAARFYSGLAAQRLKEIEDEIAAQED